MTTKAQYISQARAANPKPQHRIENGIQIELSDDEYEASLEAWAEMKLDQDAFMAAKQTAETAKASIRNKLAALGLGEAEIKELVGE